MTPRGAVHVGTSGWTYEHWLGRFYPRHGAAGPGSRLRHYARHFRSVEINASFYRMPTEAAMARWLADTPDDFVFTAKTSRFITHLKRLRDPEIHIPIFFGRISSLQSKLGAVLVQLPPQMRRDDMRLRDFVDRLPQQRYAFEFRHESWWCDEVFEILREHNMAFCLYHLAGRETPEVVTADFVYVRLHGPGAAYQGSYDAETLETWRRRIEAWRDDGRDVFVYFDNDEKAYAAEDAVRLRQMLGERPLPDAAPGAPNGEPPAT